MFKVDTPPLQPVDWPVFAAAGVELYIKRDDLLDSVCSGNKLYKLHRHLQLANAQGATRLLSFGGAYSNHLHALAALGRRLGLSTIGIVRGERPAQLSPTLLDAERWGMQLGFVSRSDYRRKHTRAFGERLRAQWGEFYRVPEGAGDVIGARGCRAMAGAIAAQLPGGAEHVCVPCGTGATLAGLASALPAGVTAHGFAVLKGGNREGEADLQDSVAALIAQLGGTAAQWRLHRGFHAGGYARFPDRLRAFMAAFEARTGILLDPVYTVKMIRGLAWLAERGAFNRGERIVAIHTGGLQGRRGFGLD